MSIRDLGKRIALTVPALRKLHDRSRRLEKFEFRLGDRTSRLLFELLYEMWSQRSCEYQQRIKKLAPEFTSAWKLFSELGQNPVDHYRPTYAEPEGELVDRIKSAGGGMLDLPFLIDLGIEGFLHKTEALKLYEMAYYADGDLLELGTHKGLSTSILAEALHDRRSGIIETIDIDAEANAIAKTNLSQLPGFERINFMVADAEKGMDDLIGANRIFGFIFVDHWHGYGATHEAAQRIPPLLSDGGYVMFHDFFDVGNKDPDHPYGVYQAVLDTLGKDDRFLFSGAAGGSGTFP
jgi:predicted O-methyltransferase YrrM